MLHYDRIDIRGGINPAKNNNSKKYIGIFTIVILIMDLNLKFCL